MKNATVIPLPKGCDDPEAIIESTMLDVRFCWDEMTQSVASNALKLGAHLNKIKAECKRAGTNFTDLFPKDKGEIGQPGKMPFSYDTGKRFANIAGNTALANSEHAHYLPSDWTAIYELSRLPAPDLTRVIEAGEVRPEMNRAEVKALVNRVKVPKSAPKQPAEPKPVTSKQLAKLVESFNEKLAETLDAGIAKKQSDALYLMPIIRTAQSLLESVQKEFIE